MRNNRSRTGFQWLILIACGLAANGRAWAQAPDLPRLTKTDTSFSQRDLKKLLRQAPASDRITDEELAKIKKEHKLNYGRGFEPTPTVKVPPRGDLYASSVILTDGADHTLLPNNSLLHVSEKYQHRVVEKPVGKLILWPDFLRRNRTWIITSEVTLAHATGEQPIPKARIEGLRKLNRVVVGVLRTHPISVLEPPPEEGEKEPGETESETASPGPGKEAFTSRYRIPKSGSK